MTESLMRDSWRVWYMPALQVPVLYTVQVHAVWYEGMRSADWYEVRTWCHWVPHWWDDVRTRKSLVTARKEARRIVEVLGGRYYAGAHTIATDATGLEDRWTVLPVDPPPPWCVAWPGPLPWRDQLCTEPVP